jgi:hypothetical protein
MEVRYVFPSGQRSIYNVLKIKQNIRCINFPNDEKVNSGQCIIVLNDYVEKILFELLQYFAKQ